MIIPRYYGLTITYSILHILTIVFPDTCNVKYLPIPYSTEVIQRKLFNRIVIFS